MKFTTVGLLVLLFFSCGTPQPKTPNVVIGKDTTTTEEKVIIPKEEKVVEPKIPNGAVSANYRNGVKAFYGYVEKVDRKNGGTTIAFENNEAPRLFIKDTYGAKLSFNRWAEFDRDLLLVTAKLKDPNFNKYFLYILKNNNWQPVVNGWAIHKSNKPETLKPIVVDPGNPNKLKRYYSVFDLDETSELGYTWRLLEESIPIVNR